MLTKKGRGPKNMKKRNKNILKNHNFKRKKEN